MAEFDPNKQNENIDEAGENATADGSAALCDAEGENCCGENNENDKANGESANAASGYMYVSAGGDRGYNCSAYTMTPTKTKPKKKNRKATVIAIVASLAVLCIVLSGLAGFGGAYFASKLLDTDGSSLFKGNDLNLVVSRGNSAGGTVNVTQTDRGELMTKSQTAAKVRDSVVEITVSVANSYYVSTGSGSGVIISADGYIVTNHHVVEDASTINVRLTDGREYVASLVGSDEQSDIALLKIAPQEDETFSAAVIGNSSELAVGDDVIVIGNPLGELGGSVTYGIISALGREITVDGNWSMTLLQTDAAVNPGNSGGGMFSLYGELVGVVNAKYSAEDVEGLGFAIPVNDAIAVVKELKENGYVTGRPAMGVSLITLESSYQVYYYFGTMGSAGVYVADPGQNDGLKKGDRLLTIDSTEITSFSDITGIISRHAIGDVIDVTVVRGGKTVDTKVTLSEKVPET